MKQIYNRIFKIGDFNRVGTSDNYITDTLMSDAVAYNRYSSLSAVIKTSATRLSRYLTFDQMDSDPDIGRILNTIADEVAVESTDGLPFIVHYHTTGANAVDAVTSEIIKNALILWVNALELDSRMFDAARQLIKYGDVFFLKTSENRPWTYINPYDIMGIEIDDHGRPVAYHLSTEETALNGMSLRHSFAPNEGFKPGTNGKGNSKRLSADQIIHMSLSSQMHADAPFGESLLVPGVKYYKYLTMMESSVIIYRLVRSTERKVFNIDVGDAPPARVKATIQAIARELNQRKSISKNASADIDTAYDAVSPGEDYFFPVNSEGKGSTVTMLQAGENLGNIEDVQYFRDKIMDGMGVPTSRTRSAANGGAQINDGKVGTAYIEEQRFTNKNKRVQRRMEPVFDAEFKKFLSAYDINIDFSLFEIRMPDPQNFAAYRQIDIDRETVSLYGQLAQNHSFSKRFLMKKYLRMTQEEINENEILLSEELGLSNASKNIMSKHQMLYDDKVFEGRQVSVPNKDTFNTSGGEESGGGMSDMGFDDFGGGGGGFDDMSGADEGLENFAGEEGEGAEGSLETPPEEGPPIDFSGLSSEGFNSKLPSDFKLLREMNENKI